MKNEHHQTLFLPDDLIFEHILPRFPVKSLIRFKSVCKNWYNFISTSEFAKYHLQFSSLSPKFFIDNYYSANNSDSLGFYLLRYDEHSSDLKELESVDLGIQLPNLKRKRRFVGCCNGLVCLSTTNDNEYATNSFIIWNPATRKCRVIRPPIYEWLCKCGFGYASALDDYKIFAAFSPFGSDESSTRNWVYSFRVGRWRHIDLSRDDDLSNSLGIVDGVLVGDFLYWSVFKSGGPFEQRIVSFSLVDDQFKEIPVTFPATEYRDFCFYVIKGCLSLHCGHHDRELPYDVWLLKRQADANISWEKLFSIPSTLGVSNHRAFSPSGKCLVNHLRQLKLVDSTLEDLEHAQGIDFGDLSSYSAVQHVESLISPISPFRTVQLYWHAWI